MPPCSPKDTRRDLILGCVDIFDIFIYSVCMSKLILSPNQWPKILAFIRECPRVYVGEEAGCNRFIEAVLWVMRSGGQWWSRAVREVEHGL